MVAQANGTVKFLAWRQATPTLEDMSVGKLIFLHNHGDLPEPIREAVRKELNWKWEELDHWRQAHGGSPHGTAA